MTSPYNNTVKEQKILKHATCARWKHELICKIQNNELKIKSWNYDI